MARISFLIPILLTFLLLNGASATVFNSNTTKTFNTIQEAINDGETTDGHFLLVNSGDYHENVLVSKTLRLECNGTVTVNANDTNQPVFNLTANNILIRGFTIKNGLYGIHLEGSEAHIINNTLINNWNGIHIEGSFNNIISNNTIIDGSWNGIGLCLSTNNIISNNTVNKNGNGISISYGSGNNTIINNTITSNSENGVYLSLDSESSNTLSNNIIASNNWMGIALLGGSGNIITNNTVTDNNLHGIWLGWTSSCLLRDNSLSGNEKNLAVYGKYDHDIDASNTINGRPIIYLKDVSDQVITGDLGYIGLINATNVTVTGVTIERNGQGILIAQGSGNSVVNCTIKGCEEGVLLEGSSNNTITNSILTSNRNGIYMGRSCNTTIINNTVNNNAESGIYIEGSENHITNNTFINNWNGIYLQRSGHNIISNNTINHNWNGIYLEGSENHITNNTISQNSNGIYLYGPPQGNFFAENYFINNTHQIAGDPGDNCWNTTEAGNYWSDYTGDDLNGDGTGDTPYPSENKPIDQKPLIVDLMIENITLTYNDIQVIVKNNGKADIRRIDPNSRFKVQITYNTQEFTEYIDPLPAGGRQRITRTITINPGDMQVRSKIPYNKTQYLENTDIRDANITNNIKNINITGGSLSVTPTSGKAPLKITVSCTIANTGDLEGNYTAVFYVKGLALKNQAVTVPANATVNVAFQHTLSSAGSYRVAINNLTGVVTVISPGISIRELVKAATSVKAYYARHGRLPVNVMISGRKYSMAQLLYLLCMATINIDAGKVADITSKSVKTGASSGRYSHGRIYRSEYVRVARNIRDFINRTARAPSYACTSHGRIPFQRLTRMYTEILIFYGTQKRLPEHLRI